MKRIMTAAALLSVLSGCSTPGEVEPAAVPAARDLPSETLGEYNNENILAEAERLIDMIPESRDAKAAAIVRLKQALETESFRAAAGPVGGVIAYSAAQGGFIFSGGGGNGRVSFEGGEEAVPFNFSVASGGASIGGSRGWGVGIVCGLGDQASFNGEYSGQARNASFFGSGKSYAQLAKLEVDGSNVVIYAFGTAVGASAGLGKARVNVQAVEEVEEAEEAEEVEEAEEG
jgi:hypothetical protein